MQRLKDYLAFSLVLSCVALPLLGMIAGLLYLSANYL